MARYYRPEHEDADRRIEREGNGFRVLWQGGQLGGDVVCARG